MHLAAVRILNYRRLKNVWLTLEPDLSVLVGANNSGKTSATHAIRAFLEGDKASMSLHDFCCDCWREFDQIEDGAAGYDASRLPTIVIDMWFSIAVDDLPHVAGLLPGLDWEGNRVGIRIAFAPTDPAGLMERFRAAYANADETKTVGPDGAAAYFPWPDSLRSYLSERLAQEYEFRHFVLDHTQFIDGNPREGYIPEPFVGTDSRESGTRLLKKLIRIDFVHAQRHITDHGSDLSRVLSRYYSKQGTWQLDIAALAALAASERKMDEHFEGAFRLLLDKLKTVGFPGPGNPHLKIRSSLDPSRLLSAADDTTRIHYSLSGTGVGEDDYTLPDKYNGLGFKNLIYIVIQIIEAHTAWRETPEHRPPLHLVCIEEPEAHMHAQLQQALVRTIGELLDPEEACTNQLVVTTHSPHVLYERGFKHIRYFRRASLGTSHTSDVLNLATLYATLGDDADFLERYMKLTHCDLFFADAAILVEGNVERLLLPLMIQRSAPTLRSAYISILEVGGNYAFAFKSLIHFLGLTTLVITDIDSVLLAPITPADAVETDAAEEDDDDDVEVEEDNPAVEGLTTKRRGKACRPLEPNAHTSNPTLRKWMPKRLTIVDLLEANVQDRSHVPTAEDRATVHIVYQTMQVVTWGETTGHFCARTLEESFALANLTWTQHIDRKDLRLQVKNGIRMNIDQITSALYNKVVKKSFAKTDFALALLQHDEEWIVPPYIQQGLTWLNSVVVPTPPGDALLQNGGLEHGQSA